MSKFIAAKSQVSAAYYLQHPWELLKGLSTDVVAFAVIFVAVAAYGLYRGKENLVSLILSLYLALAAFTSSAFLQSFILFKQNNTQLFFSKLVIYLILVFLINLVLNRIISPAFIPMSKMRGWLEIAMLSIAATASFMVIAFNALSLASIYTPSLVSVSILASSVTLFWTLIGSLVIIFFAGR